MAESLYMSKSSKERNVNLSMLRNLPDPKQPYEVGNSVWGMPYLLIQATFDKQCPACGRICGEPYLRADDTMQLGGFQSSKQGEPFEVYCHTRTNNQYYPALRGKEVSPREQEKIDVNMSDFAY